MSVNRVSPSSRRIATRARNLRVESLEPRLVLSAAGAATAMAHPFGHPDSAVKAEVSTRSLHERTTSETISGHVLNQSSGRGVSGVKVQLINADGRIVRATRTNHRGAYGFRVFDDGAYVVREVLPRRFTQVTPTFTDTAPTGGFANGFGADSYNYVTGNSDPNLGPVGTPFWKAIAPAGKLPFEAPINLTGPTIDLSRFLSVHYASATPTKIVNNGHQIQAQFPTNSTADTITLGGQTYTLAQFHYHDQSENVVNGQGYTMEEHFVNVSASGAETVVAVFFQLGAHNDALDPVLDAASTLTKSGDSTPGTTPIDFSGLLPTNKQGWFYQGSLTTPPLSQSLNWLVFSTPVTLDFAQLQKYEAVASASGFLPNNRPVQPTDGRQLNEFNYDVNLQSQSIAGLDFTVAPTTRARAAKRA